MNIISSHIETSYFNVEYFDSLHWNSICYKLPKEVHMISQDERQKRILQIEDENKALRDLNNLTELNQRINNEPSLSEQVGLIEDTATEHNPLKKIANPNADSSI